ncbi:conjugal transfer coupling protein TraG [Mycobacteroides abscessus subsp. abscessus]|nr:conjugal transfer coupling protein TraG [Mycobacteroides abscessus subsp. abscessus]
MSGSSRKKEPGSSSSEAILVWLCVGLVVLTLGTVWVCMHAGHALAGTGAALPLNPFDVAFGLAKGSLAWPGTWGWVVLGTLAALVVAAIVAVSSLVSKRAKKRTRVDRAAAHMGRGRDVADVSHKSAVAKAKRMGIASSPGVAIGKTVAGGQLLYGSWEDMHIDIWGPRTGKTTSRAVPAILDAPGAVLVTSNKRDIVDASRLPREECGPVWVFDPQSIAAEEPNWWWNPLSYVTDEVKAAELASHFSAGSRDASAKTDAYFDGEGQDLLAGLLLAAALDDRPITQVYMWIADSTDDEPVEILREHNFPLQSAQVAGVVNAPEKQRGGVYGTARQMASCLTNRQVLRWITPTGPDDERPQFSPDDFVRAGGTLYSLSKEGRGTAGPLVTALTVAVVDAAENLAVTSPGGRLKTPMLAVLDEAANVCRWAQLPNLYSHYGSRGIVIMTILQSWSQGCEVWGEAGMKKLWSASNVAVYGGGVKESAFLEDLSRIIGDYERISTSTSTAKGQRSVSRQSQKERILDVADLAAMPKGRAVVLASGSRPTLVTTQPWMSGPHREAVEASIRKYDPAGNQTIHDAHAEREAVEADLAQEGSAR